jgi:hypothetical protein
MKKMPCLDKIFNLNLKKIGLIILGWIIAVLFHNGISALFGWEEPIFFIIAVIIIPIYFFFSVLYSLAKWIKEGKWKEK